MYHCFNNNNVNLDSWKASELILLGNEELGAKDDTTIVGSKFIGGWREMYLVLSTIFCYSSTLGWLSNSSGSQCHLREMKGHIYFIKIPIL